MSISTYVFFDIETTGLPYQERNQTKITELAFVAASAEEIHSTQHGSLPLVNKLSLLFNPEKKISTKAEILSRLSNTSLAKQPIFKEKIKTLNSFLDELPKPVCLVAHNGNRFDFKILVAEYKDAQAEIPAHLLCVDSLSIFRKILKNSTKPNPPKQNTMSPTFTSSPNTTVDSIITDDEDEWQELNISAEEWREIDNLVLSLSNMSCGAKESKQNISKKKGTNKQGDAKEKVSYTLSALYKRLLNKEPIEAHRAEVDCLMLLECVVATKSTFLTCANEHVVPLSNIKPLQRY